MKGTPTKGVLRRIAADADQFSSLLHHTHAPLLPWHPQLRLPVCERTERVVARGIHVVPTQPNLVCQTLISHVPRLPASKANHRTFVALHECRYRIRCYTNVCVLTLKVEHIFSTLHTYPCFFSLYSFNTFEMSNCTRDLDQIVPVDLDTPVVLIHTKPELIALQSLPTALTVILWFSLECLRRRRGVTNSIKNLVRVVSAFAIAASSLLSWRIVELLECDGYGNGIVWKILAAILPAAVGFVIVVPLASRSPRLAILLSLIISSAIVTTDVGFRGWWIQTHAALPLVSAQQLWNIVAVLLFLFLPSRSTPIRPVRRSLRSDGSTSGKATGMFHNVVSADALEKKRNVPSSCPPENRTTSWFW